MTARFQRKCIGLSGKQFEHFRIGKISWRMKPIKQLFPRASLTAFIFSLVNEFPKSLYKFLSQRFNTKNDVQISRVPKTISIFLQSHSACSPSNQHIVFAKMRKMLLK